MPILDDLREERSSVIDDIDAMTSAKDFDPKDSHYTEARGKAEALDTRIRAMVEWQASRDAANQIDALGARHRETEERRAATQHMTPGEIFTRSAAFESYRRTFHGTSAHVDVPLDSMIQTRAPLLTTTFTGVLPADRIAPSAAPASQTPLLDAIDRIPVSQNAVEWIFYPAAAPLAAVVAEGAQKPEAVVAPVLKTVVLDTIAHHITFSRQFAEDAGSLRAYIDGALRRGVTDKAEALAAAVLAGDATIPVTTNTGGTLLEGTRRAVAQVQAAGYTPQIIALNPSDYAAFDLAVMAGTLRGPVTNGSFWGVRPVPVGAIPSGTAYVGDFTAGMALLVRNEVRLYMTDSHASNFTLNLITELAEARGKAIVHRPEALTKVSGTVTTGLEAREAPSGRK